MSSSTLAEALNRLSRCREPADLIYSGDAARLLGSAAPPQSAAPTVSPPRGTSPVDDYSVLLARRIGTMVARLNELSGPTSQLVLTPRMVLWELMDIVRQALCDALPADMRKGASPTDKAAVAKQFNSYASSRQVPIDSAVEGLYAVSYVSVKLRVELVALQLQRRIQEELAKKHTKTAAESVAALVVTQTLLEDFVAVYNNIMLTVPIVKAAVRESNAEEAARRLAPVYPQYYYQLCDWVLVLESTMSSPPMSYTQVTRVKINEQDGTAVVDLHRPTPETPWGLLLNEQGALVDIDVSLRVFEKARKLHDLLQSTPQGASIVMIKGRSVEPVAHGDYAAYTRHLLQTLQSATEGRKNVQLVLKSSSFRAEARSLPTEVAFLTPPQGGEGTSGQRVTLILRRQSTAAEWGFTVDEQLYWRAPSTHILSKPAKEFVREYGMQLRLLAVNGVEALHMTQVQLLIEAAETVVLELLVMPKSAQDRLTASRSTTTTTAVAATTHSREMLSAEAAEPRNRISGDGLDRGRMEAAVSKFLQERAADPTAPAVPSAVDPPIAMETPLVESVTIPPSPAAAAAVIAAEGVRKGKKRGRKPKALKQQLAESTVPQSAAVSRSAADAEPTAVPSAEAIAQNRDGIEAEKTANDASEPPGACPQKPEGELVEPCTFDNQVKLTHLSEDEMVLERPSVDTPWGLPIGRLTDPSEAPQQLPLRLMSLPKSRKARVRQHPFFSNFRKQPTTWYIAAVNGTPASDAEATLKHISQLTRMTLRFLRK
ncbi:conserved hypothetical protein [Leishmania infantum JPCM5]|uniref:Uncharacterized protein n=2 Tax=Leishmania infantum TaxID=5671 RepID=A4I6M2_LEIIN|nr:conserved hypothetical protein [Leishmania infantum JPCM5]CAC9518456.1 hypothetical_protein_-_conserved [Leishmania infantum]CAM70449.1 conserved hypothetical protein [Leishmania infantum JPCM5]SUZ44309.1 hypothetical_protein_-_conserved [Leishmania infantum]|eukprot:XP_001467391.1 conserved hypothetical protein [Leishmania infantum JPCM5]